MRSSFIVGALALPGAASFALATGSSWLAPVSGNFADARRWDNGVPTFGAPVSFGVAAGTRPFVVTLDQWRFLLGLDVVNQRLTFDLAGLRGPADFTLWAAALNVVGPGEPSITFINGAFRSDVVTVGNADSAASLAFVDATAFLDLVEMPRGTLTFDHSSCTGPNGSGAPMHLATVGAGTLVLINGAEPLLAYGSTIGAGASALVTIDATSTLRATSELFAGGEAHGASGSATFVVHGAIDQDLQLGFIGWGALFLHDGANTKSVTIGNGYGAGELTVVEGAATIDGELNAFKDALVTVAGPRQTLTVNGMLKVSNEGGVINVTDGATLAAEQLNVEGTATVSGGADALMQVAIAFNGGVLEITGAGSRLEASGAVLCESSGTLRCLDGARVTTALLQQNPYGSPSALVLGVTDDPTPVVTASEVIGLAGTLKIVASPPLPPGSVRTLIAAPAFAAQFASIEAPIINGYPLLYSQDENGATVRFTDHVDAFEILAPRSLAVGYAANVTASVSLDGASYDLTQEVEWTSSDESVLRLEAQDVVRAMAPGTATLTATIGVLEATQTVRVTPQSGPQSYVLASGSSTLIANGNSGSEGGGSPSTLLARGSVTDHGTVAFESTATSFDDGGTSVRQVLVSEFGPGAVGLIEAVSIEQVSVDSAGASASQTAHDPRASADGRFVAFSTSATLAGVPTNNKINTYVRDRELGTTELISVTLSGGAATTSARPAAISPDGRFVLFTSAEGNLVAADTNGKSDAFVRDRLTATTTRVTLDQNGGELAFDSIGLDFSADASRVVFYNQPSQNQFKVAVKDVPSGALIDVSGPVSIVLLDGTSASITRDGNLVAFLGRALAIDPNAPLLNQAFVRNLATGELTVVSRTPEAPWADAECSGVAISGNGRFVTFVTGATNLIAFESANPTWRQIYRNDLATGELDLISVGPSGVAEGAAANWTAMSADGRALAFATSDDTLAPFDVFAGTDVIVWRSGSFVAGDVSEDGVVNAIDLALLIGAWGTTNAEADLDGDGDVDASDLGTLLGSWTGT